MEIKIKLSDVLNAQAALEDILAQRPSPSAGLKIARAIKVVAGELETYNGQRMELIKKHNGVLNKKANEYEFADKSAFLADHTDLVATEITLHVDKIKLADLEESRCEHCKKPVCSPAVATMMQLDWLIEG